MTQRAGQKVFAVPGEDWGVRIIQPAAAVVGGWWDDFGNIGCCIAAWEGEGAADYPTSLIDLTGNGWNLIENPIAPNWDPVNGWSGFFALNTCFDTALVPSALQTWSMFVKFTGAVFIGTSLCGVINGAGNDIFRLGSQVGGTRVRYDNGNRQRVAPQMAAGTLAVAGDQGYRNGVADGPLIGAWGNPSVNTVFVGAYNNAGLGPAGIFDGAIQKCSLYDCVLNAAEVAAVHAAA